MTKKTPPQKNAKAKTKAKTKGLGKGLSALLGDAAVAATLTEEAETKTETTTSSPPPQVSSSQNTVGEMMVGIEHIHPGPWQPRRYFDADELENLAMSLKTRGVVQPLLVRPDPDNPGQYQLIAGERRWRAAQQAGIHELPVLVRDTDELMAAELALIENVQRHDLSGIEEARGYENLMDNHGYTQFEISEMVGKSRSHITNTMRLMALPDDVQELIITGKLSAGQARPLIGHEHASELAHKISAANMTAREVEIMMTPRKGSGGGGGNKKAGGKRDPDLVVLENGLSARLGLNVKLHFNEKTRKGRVVIEFKDMDQFDSIVEKLK